MNDPKSRSKGIFIASTSLVHEYPFTFQTSTLRHFRIIIQHFHASMRIFSSRGNISRRRSVDSPLSAIIERCKILPLLGLGYCPWGQYAFAVALLPSRAIRAPGAAMCSLRCAHTPRFFCPPPLTFPLPCLRLVAGEEKSAVFRSRLLRHYRAILLDEIGTFH